MNILKKVAVIELGTLQVKLTIVKAMDNETFEIVNQKIDALRIASDLYEDWLIKPSRTQELIVILKNYKAYCQAEDAQQIECVASCEYADAKNRSSFVEELYTQCGFKFKILDKDEQIGYNYTAVANTIDSSKGLIVSLEGNKTQFLNYNRRSVLATQSIDFGSCNLAESCSDSKLSPQEYCEKMAKKFARELDDVEWLKDIDAETQLIGTGSIFLSLGKLSRKLKKYPYEKEHNYILSRQDFYDVYDFVKVLDINKTKKIKGISSDRADVLASGLSAIKAIVDKTKCETIAISENGLSMGIIFNLVSPVTLEKPISDILGYSLSKNTEAYNNYSENTNTVYNLAMLLYKQLRVLHKLPRQFLKVLRVTATMHDCGKRISVLNYQKNGFDIVLKSDLYGLSHKEQILSAFAVASQKSEDFSPAEFVKYRELITEEEINAAKKLGIIVRMASALDAFNKNRVKDISCDILGDSVILKTIVDTPVEMEIREALKCEVDFFRAFKKRLEIL